MPPRPGTAIKRAEATLASEAGAAPIATSAVQERDASAADFRELHGGQLHGFALLLTLGDRSAAAKLAADALTEGSVRAHELQHPRQATAWLRHSVLAAAKAYRTDPNGDEPARRATLRALGVNDEAFAALSALGMLERAAVVASSVEAARGTRCRHGRRARSLPLSAPCPRCTASCDQRRNGRALPVGPRRSHRGADTRDRSAGAGVIDHHTRYSDWLVAGAAGDPPRDLAVHAVGLRNLPARGCGDRFAASDRLPWVSRCPRRPFSRNPFASRAVAGAAGRWPPSDSLRSSARSPCCSARTWPTLPDPASATTHRPGRRLPAASHRTPHADTSRLRIGPRDRQRAKHRDSRRRRQRTGSGTSAGGGSTAGDGSTTSGGSAPAAARRPAAAQRPAAARRGGGSPPTGGSPGSRSGAASARTPAPTPAPTTGPAPPAPTPAPRRRRRLRRRRSTLRHRHRRPRPRLRHRSSRSTRTVMALRTSRSAVSRWTTASSFRTLDRKTRMEIPWGTPAIRTTITTVFPTSSTRRRAERHGLADQGRGPRWVPAPGTRTENRRDAAWVDRGRRAMQNSLERRLCARGEARRSPYSRALGPAAHTGGSPRRFRSGPDPMPQPRPARGSPPRRAGPIRELTVVRRLSQRWPREQLITQLPVGYSCHQHETLAIPSSPSHAFIPPGGLTSRKMNAPRRSLIVNGRPVPAPPLPPVDLGPKNEASQQFAERSYTSAEPTAWHTWPQGRTLPPHKPTVRRWRRNSSAPLIAPAPHRREAKARDRLTRERTSHECGRRRGSGQRPCAGLRLRLEDPAGILQVNELKIVKFWAGSTGRGGSGRLSAQPTQERQPAYRCRSSREGRCCVSPAGRRGARWPPVHR